MVSYLAQPAISVIFSLGLVSFPPEGGVIGGGVIGGGVGSGSGGIG